MLFGILFGPAQYARAGSVKGITTNDYFVNHKSIEPFYGQYHLDPGVVIHVREVVLSGRERTAPSEGKVILLLHGYSVPGYVSFDLDHENCSLMRYLARAGWDTFALDYEGHGQSTRPPSMDMPSAFPESKATIHSDVAVNDVERVADFIFNLRGVDKIHVLGWSLGASRTAPIFTIRNQDKVARLVLFAPGYKSLGIAEAFRRMADYQESTLKMNVSRPSYDGWKWLGSREEIIVPGVVQAVSDAMLASDPRSGELGGSYRVPLGRSVDLLRADTQFDASKITVPTMVIRGEYDTFATRDDNKLLVEELGGKVKQYVEIAGAAHQIPWEKTNLLFFKTVLDFIEAK
jgi:pimeloyl-ACP methyl ester carboxylesterase